MIGTIIASILVIASGYILTRIIKLNGNHFIVIGSSILLGIGIESFLLFLIGLLDYKISLGNLLLLNLPGLLFLLIKSYPLLSNLKNNTFNLKIINNFLQNSIELKVLIIFSIGLIFLNLIYNLYWPVDGWDAFILYDFRGQYFAQSGTIIPTMEMKDFLSYPYATSLSHTIFYLLDGNPRFLYSLFYIAFILIFFGQLKVKYSTTWSLFGTISISLYPLLFEHTRIPYTNFPYTVFYLSGLLFLYNWYQTNKSSFLISSSLLIMFSCWTRYSDPFWIIPIIMVIYISIKTKKYYLIVIYALPILFMRELWTYYIKMIDNQFSNTTAEQFTTVISGTVQTPITVQLLTEVLYHFYHAILLPNQNILIIFVLVFIQETLRNKVNWFLFWLVILNLLMFLVGIFTLAVSFNDWQSIIDSGTRLSMFLIPK